LKFLVGQNIDSYHWQNDEASPVNDCIDAGFNAIRDAISLTLPIEVALAQEEAVRARGAIPMRCLPRESFTGQEWQNGEFESRIRTIRNKLGNDCVWNPGNEWEHGGGPASSGMTPRNAGRIVTQTRKVAGPDAVIWAPPLVLGNPYIVADSHLEGEWQEADVFDLHIYEMSPDYSDKAMRPFEERNLDWFIPAVVDAARKLNMPLGCSEMGAGLRYFKTPSDQARFYDLSNSRLVPYFTAGIVYYCGYRIMHDDYYHSGEVGSGRLPVWDVCSRFAQAQTSMIMPPPVISDPILVGGRQVLRTEPVYEKMETFLAKRNMRTWPNHNKTDITPQTGKIRRALLDHPTDWVEVVERFGWTSLEPIYPN